MSSRLHHLRSWTRRLLDERDEERGRPFARFISALIALSVGLLCVEFL
ncbi:MAG: hypothetical protein ACOX6T_08850 [Myxococcales bacterium]|jgi:hypothetical protein